MQWHDDRRIRKDGEAPRLETRSSLLPKLALEGTPTTIGSPVPFSHGGHAPVAAVGWFCQQELGDDERLRRRRRRRRLCHWTISNSNDGAL